MRVLARRRMAAVPRGLGALLAIAAAIHRPEVVSRLAEPGS